MFDPRQILLGLGELRGQHVQLILQELNLVLLLLDGKGICVRAGSHRREQVVCLLDFLLESLALGLQRHHCDRGKIPGLLEVFEFMLASPPAPQGRLQFFVDLGHTGQPGVVLEEIFVGGVGLQGRVGGAGRLQVVVEVLHPFLAVEDPRFPAVRRHDGQFVCRARRGEGNRRHGNKRVDDQVCFKARLVAEGAEIGVGPPPGARPAIARLGLVQFVLHAEGFFLNILILGVMPRLQSAFPVGKAGRQALCSRGVQRGPVRHLSNERDTGD